jgi:hypothetical protein
LHVSVADLGDAKPGMPRIVRKRSKLHGFGVFAAEPITKNTRIIDYAGELVRNSRSGAREARYLAKGAIWVFRVNRTWSRDAAVDGNIARSSTTPASRTAGSRSWTRRSGSGRRDRFAPARS